MKKTILSIAIMAIFLTSCGSSTTTETQTTDSINVSIDTLKVDTTISDTGSVLPIKN